MEECLGVNGRQLFVVREDYNWVVVAMSHYSACFMADHIISVMD